MALLSVTLSSSITYKLFGLSFFDRQLLDRGVDLRRGREYIHMTQIYVGDANYLDSLDRDPLNLTITQPLTEALEVASEFVGESIPILEGEKLRGAINEGDLFKKILDIEDSLRSDQSSNSKH
jgi:CIC family chloride channel protein